MLPVSVKDHQSAGRYLFGQCLTFQLPFLSSSRDHRRHSHHLTSAAVLLALASFVPQLSLNASFLFRQVICHVLISLNVGGFFSLHHFQFPGRPPREP
jgi:hypothetical protein